VILFAFLLLSASGLAAEVWLDEGLTLSLFVSKGPGYILTSYYIPNNHILYNLLLWPLYALGGGWDAPMPLLRSLSLAAALAGIVFLYKAMERWAGEPEAVLAAAFLGLSHSYIIFSTQLRGYPMSAALVALGLFFLTRMTERNALRCMGSFAVTAVVAVGVLPTNLVPFVCMGLFFFLCKPKIKQSWLLPIAPFAGFVWYVRVIDAFVHNLQYGYGKTSALQVAQSLLLAALADIWWAWPCIALGLAAAAARKRARARAGSVRREMLFHVIVFGAILAALLRPGKAPFPRTFFPMLPLVFASLALICGRGLSVLRRSKTSRKFLLRAALAVSAVAVARECVYPRWFRAHFADRLPQGLYHQWFRVDYKPSEVIKFINAVGARSKPVVCVADTNFGLWYYRLKLGCEHGKLIPLGSKLRRKFPPFAELAAEGRLLVLSRNKMELKKILDWLGITPRPDVKEFMRVGHMTAYRIVTRAGRGGRD